MSDDSPAPVPAADDDAIAVRCYFVRHRNALVTRASFGELYTDYYLHLMQHGLKVEPTHDQIFKEALATFTLYLASRPWKEVTAWTANLQSPLLNVFVTGNSLAGTVTGRVFSQDVRKQEKSLLYSQVRPDGEEPRQSIIEFSGNDFFSIAEQFHHQSDQRKARFFEHTPEDYVLVAAQPDCDEEWLDQLDAEAVRNLDQTEELSLLETRHYRFHCGCDIGRVLPALTPLSDADLDHLFAETDAVRINCPRCSARFPVTRADVDARRKGSQKTDPSD